MTKKPVARICSNCGMEKPLSAFLQLSEQQGRSYGSICSSCRASLQSKTPGKEKDEGTRSGTGVVIDSKAKVHSDIERQQQFDEIEAEYNEDRDEKQIKEQDEQELKADKINTEKKHRQHYLDRSSFLGIKKTGDDSRAEASRWLIENQNLQTHGDEQNTQKDLATQEEQASKDINLTAPFEDTRIAGKIKFSGDSFKRFSSWIGKDSPINRLAEQHAEKNPSADKDKTLSEFVENNWGPKSRK